MDSVVGESEGKLLIVKRTGETSQEIHLLEVSGSWESSDLLLKCPSAKLIKQASLQHLVKDRIKTQSLLTLVQCQVDIDPDDGGTTEEKERTTYEATLYLLENLTQFSSPPPPSQTTQPQQKWASIVILEEILLVNPQLKPLHLYVLPPSTKEPNRSIPLTVETPCIPTPLGSGADLVTLRTKVIALSLEECITIYDIETTLSSAAEAKIEIISSEFVAKSFWWSQWVSEGNFLAFAHWRKQLISSVDEQTVSSLTSTKPILSVFQFRGNLPQETVLNLPLEGGFDCLPNDRGGPQISFVPNPNVLCQNVTLDTFRILAHTSGHVSIIQLASDSQRSKDGSKVIYKVNALHHNKTLVIKSNGTIPDTVEIDTCLFQNGQFVAVVSYPFFVHLLDIGVEHDPSHHLLLDWSAFSELPGVVPLKFRQVRVFATNFGKPQILSSRTGNTQLILRDELLEKIEVEINSTLLIPLMLQKKPDIAFNTAVIHYLVVHLNDVNAVKKIIYEMCKSLASPYLTEIFQEFLIANSYLVTSKNLMPNMKIFLHFLPYTAHGQGSKSSQKIQHGLEEFSVEILNNTATVPTVLLSPRQRILTHSEVDLWTQLWEVNALFSKSTRFCHQGVAHKLILSFQCYQPEALSRATTPMSPSSPMICNSLGDIAALFGRRTSDLQLPFAEHESCTANKQEYVYSVNLRELSTHLLKERRDWPLHGQTVSGKYLNALVESGRLLCHLTCLCLHLQPIRKCKGFKLIDTLSWNVRLKLFMLFEHISIALGTLACPLPQGFTPFFAYLGYSVLKYDQFLWHVRSGTFDLQIDLVKTIMADLTDSNEDNVAKKLHLISLLPKTRGTRVLNSWSHKTAICLRARQHASDLLSGVTSLPRKNVHGGNHSNRVRMKESRDDSTTQASPLDTFFTLLTAKANMADIDFGLLTEATMLSMQCDD